MREPDLPVRASLSLWCASPHSLTGTGPDSHPRLKVIHTPDAIRRTKRRSHPPIQSLARLAPQSTPAPCSHSFISALRITFQSPPDSALPYRTLLSPPQLAFGRSLRVALLVSARECFAAGSRRIVPWYIAGLCVLAVLHSPSTDAFLGPSRARLGPRGLRMSRVLSPARAPCPSLDSLDPDFRYLSLRSQT